MLEITDKISSYLKKNNLANFLKLCIILISLFLIARLFTQNTSSSLIVENFLSPINSNEKFGNEIGYIKSSTNNTEYTFKLDDIVQLDSIYFEGTSGISNFKYLDSNNNVKTFSVNLNKQSLNITNTTAKSTYDIYSNIITNLRDDDNNPIITDTIIISNATGFLINKIEFYGTKIGLINREEFNNTLAQLANLTFLKQSNSMNIFTTIEDTFINSISFTMKSNSPPVGIQSVKYNIYYYNNIYPGTKFTISNNFKIRVDSESNYNSGNGTRTTSYLYKPIIANKIIIELEPIVNFNISLDSAISVSGKRATPEEKNIFKVNNQSVIDTTTGSSDPSNICPTMDEIMDKQTKAQQICDNIEYQDKIKSEKIRLEKNRQYLLKLKTQEEQIDQLNTLINGLQSKRETRDKNNDMLRVAQYQKQREESSIVRDLANQRLQSQDQNKLFFNVKVNAT